MISRGISIGVRQLIGLRNVEQCLVEGVQDSTLQFHDEPLADHQIAGLINDGTLRDFHSITQFRHEPLSQLSEELRDQHDEVRKAAYDLAVRPYLSDNKYKPWPTLWSDLSYTHLAEVLQEGCNAISPESLANVIAPELLPVPRPFPTGRTAYTPWDDDLWHVFQVTIKAKIQQAIDQSCIAPGGGVLVL